MRSRIFLFCLLIQIPVFASIDTSHIYEIIVTGTRLPEDKFSSNQSVTVLDGAMLSKASVQNISDVLEYAGGVDVRQRSASGVQSDVSLRGGTFEQTLVLIDGVRVSDPQTGHHNMNLPVPLSGIDRIEVLRGNGSRAYGPNGLGGVINIITKTLPEKNIRAYASLGEFGYKQFGARAAYPLLNSQHRISFDKQASDGYVTNTNFDANNIFYSGSITGGFGNTGLMLGYLEKDFGAYKFYSDAFPNEHERLKTGFVNISWKKQVESLLLSSHAYYRRNNDDFMLDQSRPDWNHNTHTTGEDGAEFELQSITPLGKLAAGTEYGNDRIKSNNLGDHERFRGGVYGEYKNTFVNRFDITLGAYGSYYSDWGWDVWPGVDAGIRLLSFLRLYGSAGRSFRVPTFTDLYYTSPSNIGNPNLMPEEALTYESGIKFSKNEYSVNGSLFRREGYNLIDWIRQPGTVTWFVMNHTQVNFNGVEISASITPFSSILKVLPIKRIGLSYEYLTANTSLAGMQSRYVLDYLKHQVIGDLSYGIYRALEQSWRVRYEQRIGNDSHVLVDSKLTWSFKQFGLYVDISNLLDTQYTEIGQLPMPGRWIRSGLSMNL